jgi:toxin ParE1/3/4
MSRQLLRHEAAKQDLIEAAYYIAQGSLDASDRFLRATEEAFRRLAEMPGMGSRRDFGNPALSGMRMWPVPGFRGYLIFYRATEDTLEIIRVLHGARDLPSIFSAEGEWEGE